MATLLISQGVPMILGGDEFLRTQNGNNNAWCQDNEMSWVDWSLKDGQRRLSSVRQEDDQPAEGPSRFRRRTFFTGGGSGGPPEILWHGVEPAHPDFSPTSQTWPWHSTAAVATARE